MLRWKASCDNIIYGDNFWASQSFYHDRPTYDHIETEIVVIYTVVYVCNGYVIIYVTILKTMRTMLIKLRK